MRYFEWKLKHNCKANHDDSKNVMESVGVDITVNHLQAKFIWWPDAGERAAIAQSFATKNNFPSIIGAIDGSHIPIIAPNE